MECLSHSLLPNQTLLQSPTPLQHFLTPPTVSEFVSTTFCTQHRPGSLYPINTHVKWKIFYFLLLGIFQLLPGLWYTSRHPSCMFCQMLRSEPKLVKRLKTPGNKKLQLPFYTCVKCEQFICIAAKRVMNYFLLKTCYLGITIMAAARFSSDVLEMFYEPVSQEEKQRVSKVMHDEGHQCRYFVREENQRTP